MDSLNSLLLLWVIQIQLRKLQLDFWSFIWSFAWQTDNSWLDTHMIHIGILWSIGCWRCHSKLSRKSPSRPRVCTVSHALRRDEFPILTQDPETDAYTYFTFNVMSCRIVVQAAKENTRRKDTYDGWAERLRTRMTVEILPFARFVAVVCSSFLCCLAMHNGT